MSKSDLEKHIWMSQQILLSSEGRHIIKSQYMAAAPPAEEKFTYAVYGRPRDLFELLFTFCIFNRISYRNHVTYE